MSTRRPRAVTLLPMEHGLPGRVPWDRIGLPPRRRGAVTWRPREHAPPEPPPDPRGVGSRARGHGGEPMATRLALAGIDLTVWNRSPEKSELLRASGAA